MNLQKKFQVSIFNSTFCITGLQFAFCGENALPGVLCENVDSPCRPMSIPNSKFNIQNSTLLHESAYEDRGYQQRGDVADDEADYGHKALRMRRAIGKFLADESFRTEPP